MKRTKRLNPMSLKKIGELNAEVPIRIKLCKRAGGKPYIVTKTIRLNDGTKHELVTVRCIDGKCECNKNCKERGELHPHEQVYRSRGGKVTLKNSRMVLNHHHAKIQNNEPKLTWIKGDANGNKNGG